MQTQLFLLTGNFDSLCPLALRSNDPGHFFLLNFFSHKSSYYLRGRVKRIMIEPRDPYTNSNGFPQAELLEYSVKVIVCIDNKHEKFSLNLLLCIAFIHHLCHIISRPVKWVEQPWPAVPPWLRLVHTATLAPQVSRSFRCRYCPASRYCPILAIISQFHREVGFNACKHGDLAQTRTLYFIFN